MRLAELSAKTLHGFLAIEEFSALGLGDTGRDLSSKLIVVLVVVSRFWWKSDRALLPEEGDWIARGSLRPPFPG